MTTRTHVIYSGAVVLAAALVAIGGCSSSGDGIGGAGGAGGGLGGVGSSGIGGGSGGTGGPQSQGGEGGSNAARLEEIQSRLAVLEGQLPSDEQLNDILGPGDGFTDEDRGNVMLERLKLEHKIHTV